MCLPDLCAVLKLQRKKQNARYDVLLMLGYTEHAALQPIVCCYIPNEAMPTGIGKAKFG